ncbi:hypothetical protein FME95_03460 [Reinekea thalattae]|uniref:Uncharacterized protein n=1 Tax=Reinekea thalattae TaxID=2593301 RepID=A0A5C8ZCS8_9GAMM|nr:hypothetical protein FME95_03460 [Reinekea thalattae]
MINKNHSHARTNPSRVDIRQQ